MVMAKHHKEKLLRTRSDKIFDAVNMVFIVLVLILCAYPIYYTIIASFSDPNAVITGEVLLWPVRVTLDSYRSVFDYRLVWTGYRNTIFYTVLGTIYNLILLLPASYGLSRKTLKGRNLLMAYFVFTMYFQGGTIPFYLLIRNMGLIDNPVVLIIPAAVSVYNMIITRTYFSSFPEELREAAKIDGASEFRIFWQVVLPLSGAIIAVMALYYAVGHWNDYFNAMIGLRDRELFPLQLFLREILVQSQISAEMLASVDVTSAEAMMEKQQIANMIKYCVIIVSTLPMLIAYPFLQRYFIRGVMIGSVKG